MQFLTCCILWRKTFFVRKLFLFLRRIFEFKLLWSFCVCFRGPFHFNGSKVLLRVQKDDIGEKWDPEINIYSFHHRGMSFLFVNSVWDWRSFCIECCDNCIFLWIFPRMNMSSASSKLRGERTTLPSWIRGWESPSNPRRTRWKGCTWHSVGWLKPPSWLTKRWKSLRAGEVNVCEMSHCLSHSTFVFMLLHVLDEKLHILFWWVERLKKTKQIWTNNLTKEIFVWQVYLLSILWVNL